MSTTVSTKRNPAAVNGVVGAAVTNLSSLTLAYTPYPVSPETAEKYKLQSPRKVWSGGAFGTPDVLEGDLLTWNGIDYVIRAVAKWVSPVLYTKFYFEEIR